MSEGETLGIQARRLPPLPDEGFVAVVPGEGGDGRDFGGAVQRPGPRWRLGGVRRRCPESKARCDETEEECHLHREEPRRVPEAMGLPLIFTEEQ